MLKKYIPAQKLWFLRPFPYNCNGPKRNYVWILVFIFHKYTVAVPGEPRQVFAVSKDFAGNSIVSHIEVLISEASERSFTHFQTFKVQHSYRFFIAGSQGRFRAVQ